MSEKPRKPALFGLRGRRGPKLLVGALILLTVTILFWVRSHRHSEGIVVIPVKMGSEYFLATYRGGVYFCINFVRDPDAGLRIIHETVEDDSAFYYDYKFAFRFGGIACGGGRHVGYWFLGVPMWLVALLCVGGIWWGLRRRKGEDGVCPTCGYDLRASKNICPECGKAIPAMIKRKPLNAR